MKILEGPGSTPCPECGGKARCANSRPAEVMEQRAIYRRRVCITCDYRWSTIEIPADLLESLIEDVT